MRARRDPILLLRFALREGDHRLADLLLARFRSDGPLAAHADAELVRVPRAGALGLAFEGGRSLRRGFGAADCQVLTSSLDVGFDHLSPNELAARWLRENEREMTEGPRESATWPQVGAIYRSSADESLRVDAVEPGERLGREIRGLLSDGTPYACDRRVFSRVWTPTQGSPDGEDEGTALTPGRAGRSTEPDPSLDLHVGDIRTAVDAATEALSERAEDALRERDLEEALVEALGPSLGHAQRQYSVNLRGWKGRVGPLDLAILDEDGSPSAVVEVKWGGTALWNCAWDAVKLAASQHEGIAPRAFLVAGASVADWNDRRSGTELFDSRTWDLAGFLARFAEEFAFWRTDVANHPTELPRSWRTEKVVSTKLVVGEEPWEIRVVAIADVEGVADRIRYAPVTRAETGLRAEKGTASTRHEPVAPIGESAGPLGWLEAAGRTLPPTHIAEGGSVTAVQLAGLLTDEGTLADLDDVESDPASFRHVRWFASHSQRRAYAEAQGWRQPGSQSPDVMAISGGSGLGASFALTWNGTELEVTRTPLTDQRPHTDHVRPSDDAWRRLWMELDRIDVWSWSYVYEPRSTVMDGYGWEVALVGNGRSCDSRGYMAFPGEHPELESSSTWQAFLLALGDLVGGEPFI